MEINPLLLQYAARLGSLYSGGMTGDSYADQNPYDDPNYVQMRMSQLYHPEHTAIDAYNGMFQSFPQRPQPSRLQRIFAGLASGAGAAPVAVVGGQPIGGISNPQVGNAAAEDILYGDYNRKINDFETKAKFLEPAMQAERYQNANMQSMANNELQREMQAANLRLGERKQAEVERKNQTEEQIKQQRANIYQFKAMNPGMKVITPRGGNVQLYNPATGETQDTGISSGILSDMDKINLQAEQQINAINAHGAQTRKTLGMRQSGDNTVMTDQNGNAVIVNKPSGVSKPVTTPSGDNTQLTRPVTPSTHQNGGVGTKTETPLNQKREWANRARVLKNTNPQLGQYINIMPGDEVSIKPPGRFSGPDQNTYQAIQDAIYGTSQKAGTNQQTNTSAQNPNAIYKTQTNVRTGQKRQLMSVDGGKTWTVVGGQ